MQQSISEFVKPPRREAESSEALMPATERRTSLSSVALSAVYPYFDLPGAAADVGGPGGGGGDLSGGVSSVGSQTAESSAGGGSGGFAAQPTKMRLFTVCGHKSSATTFAVCDGAVTIVSKNYEFCIKNEEFCIKHHEFCRFSLRRSSTRGTHRKSARSNLLRQRTSLRSNWWRT